MCQKFRNRFGKTALKIVYLMKETYNDKCFGDSMIFIWHCDIKKVCLSEELSPKLCRPENDVNDRNVNTL